ncbi:1,4-alpha-glucan branching protein GlgB [Anaeromicropila herbilytica]|uniref:1,4-alpha-glucan branching enzyme GlgB n=1 Tax=Anaeromicropila herbilytica TaxID=2785025 RepID=A0A7R7END5_9FIRM|nr:1,4-alpha-glucan branching protein GlgB [Anaeromicropila herbilytica]BCN32019.1 1,4-alpha-glucan branching enzyme GlgB [Anaeromicropila herbilytica]
MDEKLYNLCNWGEIEAIVYSEHDDPHKILGPQITEEGILINTFIPTAISIEVKVAKTEKKYVMERVDEAGFYAVLVPGKKIFSYTYCVTFDNQTEIEISDPYAFKSSITETDISRFSNGIHYNVYDKLGAHVTEMKGVKGVSFAVWAPNAIRVSVVGDFNLWDGRRHPMRRLGTSGIFELFIPNINEGELYKFELKLKGGLVILKSDPYAYYSELRPNTASIVYDINKYEWNDDNWLEKRKKVDHEKQPLLIYEVHLGSWIQKEDKDDPFYNYRELAVRLCDYVKEMGYTHIELMPIMEHPFDASWGYQVTGYYAATSRYGTPEDFMYFMDYMHQHGIGVILDWVPAHFPRDTFALSNFDGTCLYEHLDPRQGSHPHWGTLIFNYGRPQVANFLIANANFWVEKYHADGIRMDAVASMLYLDYGKKHGEWVANIYGGNENLEAIEMLKKLNSLFRSKKNGAILIAEESTAWPQITDAVENNGLGFQYKWNMGWMNDFINYMKCDPLFRKGRQNELTFSMVYAYSEKFILVLSHDEVVHEKGSMINKMPGDMEHKFNNLRVAYAYMMAHPGKKLLFMGQEFAQYNEWNEDKGLDWYLLDQDKNQEMKNYVKDLNWFYQKHPALYKKDFSMEGFEWINNMDSDRSILSFLRKADHKEDTLLIVCNFTPVVYEDYIVGVPFKGKYKEIFSSDKVEYGGKGNLNPRSKVAKDTEADEREYSIAITVPPMGMTIFSCTPEEVTITKSKVRRKKEVITNNKLEVMNEKKENLESESVIIDTEDNIDENSTIDVDEVRVDKELDIDTEIAVSENESIKANVTNSNENKEIELEIERETNVNEANKKEISKSKASKKETIKKETSKRQTGKKEINRKASNRKSTSNKETSNKDTNKKGTSRKANKNINKEITNIKNEQKDAIELDTKVEDITSYRDKNDTNREIQIETVNNNYEDNVDSDGVTNITTEE